MGKGGGVRERRGGNEWLTSSDDFGMRDGRARMLVRSRVAGRRIVNCMVVARYSEASGM